VGNVRKGKTDEKLAPPDGAIVKINVADGTAEREQMGVG